MKSIALLCITLGFWGVLDIPAINIPGNNPDDREFLLQCNRGFDKSFPHEPDFDTAMILGYGFIYMDPTPDSKTKSRDDFLKMAFFSWRNKEGQMKIAVKGGFSQHELNCFKSVKLKCHKNCKVTLKRKTLFGDNSDIWWQNSDDQCMLISAGHCKNDFQQLNQTLDAFKKSGAILGCEIYRRNYPSQ